MFYDENMLNGMQNATTMSDTSHDYDYDDNNSEDYLYTGYYFERIIYLYIWEILVIIACLFNVVVISVLLRKRMRNPSNMILVAIAVSDSLTGLVTLPSYIDVFPRFSPAIIPQGNPISRNFSTFNISLLPPEYIDIWINQNGIPDHQPPKAHDGYFLSEELCDTFMLSKFFLSKTFHTTSVWLTLFLAVERFLLVYFPFQERKLPMKKVIIVCLAAFGLAPILNIYHLLNDKSEDLNCRWAIPQGKDCGFDCVYLWVVLLVGQILPAILLTVSTVYFINSLLKCSCTRPSLQGSDNTGTDSSFPDRDRNKRRSSIVVTTILIAFIIPELPYSCFFAYVVISRHAEIDLDLEFNRAIYATYEILLVLSFNANFWIYTLFNKKFRHVLRETILSPIFKSTCGKIQTLSTDQSITISTTNSTTTKQTNVKQEETNF